MILLGILGNIACVAALVPPLLTHPLLFPLLDRFVYVDDVDALKEVIRFGSVLAYGRLLIGLVKFGRDAMLPYFMDVPLSFRIVYILSATKNDVLCARCVDLVLEFMWIERAILKLLVQDILLVDVVLECLLDKAEIGYVCTEPKYVDIDDLC